MTTTIIPITTRRCHLKQIAILCPLLLFSAGCAFGTDTNTATSAVLPTRTPLPYVASDPSGPVTSQISNQMNNPNPHLPEVVGLLGPADNEYAVCPTLDDRCEPPFFTIHFSYEITFQQVR